MSDNKITESNFIRIPIFGLAGFFVFIIFLWLFLKPSLSQYPNLDSCFTTSVFKINLCPDDPKYVGVNSVSKILIHSILISEDDGFYSHKGVDWNEFKKSLDKNLRLMKFARGGSTITQQLVKNIYLSHDKSIIRKFKEILLAQQMEDKYSKSIILEKYLNIIELGKNVYGVKSAAYTYFKKHPSNLNILESVYLTTLLPNPRSYSSSFYSKKLPSWQRKRISLLLDRLLQRKRISNELHQIAKSKIDLFPWENIDLNESQKVDDDGLYFLNDKSIYLNPEEPSSPEAIESDPSESEENDPNSLNNVESDKDFGPTNNNNPNQEDPKTQYEEPAAPSENQDSSDPPETQDTPSAETEGDPEEVL